MSSGISRVEAFKLWIAEDYANLPLLKPSDYTPTGQRNLSSKIIEKFGIKLPHAARPLDGDLVVGAQLVSDNDWNHDRCQMHLYGVFCNRPGEPFKSADDHRFCIEHSLKIKLQMHALQRDIEAKIKADKEKAAKECKHEPRDDNAAVCKWCQLTIKEIDDFGGVRWATGKEAVETLPERGAGKVIPFPSPRKENA